MKILYYDKKTGIEAGINNDGELYLGDAKSGYNLPDTPRNRDYIRRDFTRQTNKAPVNERAENRSDFSADFIPRPSGMKPP